MKFTNRIRRIFNPSAPFENVYHPDFRDKVEVATDHNGNPLKCRGVLYYRMKADQQVPYGRYQRLQAFLFQHEVRMDHPVFKAFINEAKKWLDGSRKEINTGKAYEVLLKMEARAELAFDPKQIYNCASVVYFDDTENIYSYDEDHNRKKIAAWMEDRKVDFFYMRPLDELLGLSDYSESALIEYIQRSSEIINDLTSDTPSA